MGLAVLACVAALVAVYIRMHLRARAHGDEDLMWQMAELVSPDALRSGMRLTIELMTPQGVRSAAGVVHAVTRRRLALSVDAGLLPVRLGTVAHITVASATAAYSFHTTVLDCSGTDDAPTVSMLRPTWMERMQRRQFFRIPVNLPTSAVWDVRGDTVPRTVRAKILDLSGGGMSLALASSPRTGTVLRVRLPIREMGEPCVDVRVLRVSSEPGALGHVASCEMLYVGDEVRNAVVQYCFSAQREQIRQSGGPANRKR